MYIQRIIDKNIGPLADVDICMPFDKNRNPKPIILVGENGSGKSTFLSNIVDSFYELARQYFRDAINPDELGNRDGYYKIISPLEIRFNQQFLFSIVYFEEGITYLYKTGEIDFSRFKELSNIKDDANIIKNKWSSDDNIKAVIRWPKLVGEYKGTPSAEGYTLEDGTSLNLSEKDQKWLGLKDTFKF